jgi:hypothetical protein
MLVEARMYTSTDKLRGALFAFAGAISVVLSGMAMLIILWAFDFQHPKPGDLRTAALLLLGPILSTPLFALVFISQRWHRMLMWLLACASFAGAYFAMRGGREVWSPLRQPFVLASISIAVLIEISYRLRSRPKQASTNSVGSVVPELPPTRK